MERAKLKLCVMIAACVPLLLAACNAPAPHEGQPTPQAQSMARMLANVELLRAYAAGTGDATSAEAAATELVSWSGQMGTLFPPETASQYVDFTPEMARGAPAVMLAQARSLQDAVRSGSRAAAGTQLARTERDGCGFCHQKGY